MDSNALVSEYRKFKKHFVWFFLITHLGFLSLSEFVTVIFNPVLDGMGIPAAQRMIYLFKPAAQVLMITASLLISHVVFRLLRPIENYLKDGSDSEKARTAQNKMITVFLPVYMGFWVTCLSLFFLLKDHLTLTPGSTYGWALLVKLSCVLMNAVVVIAFVNKRTAFAKEALNMTDIREGETDYYDKIREYLLIVPNMLFFSIALFSIARYFYFVDEVLYSKTQLFLFLGVFAVFMVSYPIFATAMVRSDNKRQMATIQSSIAKLSDGNGDLSKLIRLSSFGETGNIAVAMNRFIMNLRNDIIQLNVSAGEVGQVIESVVASSESISALSLNQSLSGKETSEIFGRFTESQNELLVRSLHENKTIAENQTSLSELREGMKALTENFSVISGFTEESRNLTGSSMETAKESAENVSKIREKMNEIEQNVSSAEEEAKGITDILRVIQEIADSTSILAMNAAIEAAHAGEAGKGFAIVASEVRSLADMSAKSVGDIKARLKKISQSIDLTSESVDIGVQMAEESSTMTHKVLSTLESVQDNAIQMNEEISVMSRRMNGQMEVTSAVTEATGNLLSFIDFLQASLEEQNAEVDEISSQIEEMNRISGLSQESASYLISEAGKLRETEKRLNSIISHFKFSD